MSKFNLAEQGTSFFTMEGLRHSVEAAASNPKIATVVAGSSMGMGVMSESMVQSVAGTVTLIAGAITAVIVLAIQGIKLVRMLKGKE